MMDVTLRALTLADAGAITAAINDRDVQDNLRDGIPYPYSEQDAKAFIATVHAMPEGAAWYFAIALEGKTIGVISATRGENVHVRTAEIGYYIARPYWKKGIGTQALKQLCATMFENTNIVRLFAEPFSHNHASCRILEKAGFVQEGILRKNAYKNGEVLDMTMYALVREA